MKNEIIARLLKFHVDGDDKLYINFAWPNYLKGKITQEKFLSHLFAHSVFVKLQL